ncbi:MAG: type II secretion system F family protein [Peptococcaceae bacterium]|nr:type II secretion system F family protein [Peptococcaceae bacterium]
MVSAVPIALFTAVAIILGAIGIDLNRRSRFSPVSRTIGRLPAAGGAAVLARGLRSMLPLVMVVYPEDVRVQTGRRLNWGGVESLTAAEFLALKLAAAACIPVAGALAGAVLGVPYMWFLLLAGAGYLIPDLWLQSRVSGRQKQIRRDMMEFATLFAVVLRAGGDMYGALQQVGRWFGGEMGREMMRAAHDMATGKRRSEALMDMAERCGVDELTQLIQVILQADRYGTPIADAVHQHAAQVRVMRRYAAEKLANEAAVKMTLPMLLFLVGPLMVLLAYPGIQQFARILK